MGELIVAVRLSSSKHKYVPSTRYLQWIDEHWYGTQDSLAYYFAEEQVEQIKEWLKNHFQLYAEFIYADGRSEKWSAFGDKFGEIEFTL